MEILTNTPYPTRDMNGHSQLSLSHSHPHPQRPCPPPLHPIHNPHAHYRTSTPATSFHAPPKPSPHVTAIYRANSMEEAQAFFKEFVENPDHVYLPSHLGAQQAPSMQRMPTHFSFRPLGGYQPAYSDAQPEMRFKAEDSTALPTPALLPGSVDASQYESIPYSEWLQASTEYQALSPSSLGSHVDSPATPGDWEPDHSLARSVFSSLQGQGQFCNSFWIAQAEAPPTFVAHGVPSTDKDSFFEQSNVVQENSQQENQGPYRVNTAAPQQLSLDGSSLGSDDGVETGAAPSSHGEDSELGDPEDLLRRQQDDLLLRMREQGYKYGDIKRHGRFKEAESTLRGRYRSLTKGKLERLRSPKWQQHDVVLLLQAVERYTDGNLSKLKTRHGGKKVPWKKIGEWIKTHGGSYLFSPATCAKKWDSIKRLAPPSPSTSSG